MLFGICTSLDHATAVRNAGWDYIEENVQSLFQGTIPDESWPGLARAKTSVLPILAANCLVPANLKITGPDADLGQLTAYMTHVTTRAKLCGTRTLVFGSGGARMVPADFDPGQARQQILAFLNMAAPLAHAQGVTIVVEHLQKAECNIITTVEEALTYVRAVNHPNIQMLVDSYHLWSDDEPVAHVQAAIGHIRHVHLADKDKRVPPGESGTADYRPLFKILKSNGYHGTLSVEANGFTDYATVGPRCLRYLKQQWAEA